MAKTFLRHLQVYKSITPTQIPTVLSRLLRWSCRLLLALQLHLFIMAIPGSAHANIGLGALVIAGGAYGFAKKGSKISLLAGLTFGGLYLGSAYMIAKTDSIYEAHMLATGASGVMALAMGQRFLSTQKFMPAGLVATLGVAACAYNYTKAAQWSDKSA
jgi:uncharacterized membrane protein (UPF0136 family)